MDELERKIATMAKGQWNLMEQAWFEMNAVRKRELAKLVWVPLRASHPIEKVGRFGYLDYREEFFGFGSLLVSAESAQEASKLRWQDIGSGQGHGPYVEDGAYVTSDMYEDQFNAISGIHLVMEQEICVGETSVWHLHPDLVIALSLKREKDTWICPNEGYVEVVKLMRDEENRPVLMEIKAEFLRDYLCARNMTLVASSYRSREEIVDDASHITWPDNPLCEDIDGGRWEGRVAEIHEGGMSYGAQTAVFHVSRTDVDPEEDIPDYGPPSGENIASASWVSPSKGTRLYRIEGEMWRNEWILPGEHSTRVRRDKLPSNVYFLTDASGSRECEKTLLSGSRWLWFRPEVMMTLAHRRGGSLGWYTRDTGFVGCSPDYRVHFGINRSSLINVFAKDIAMLPEWQQRIWAGFNVSPEGKVSEELLCAQMKSRPARTQAPEAFLKQEYMSLNQASLDALGGPLFREHDQHTELFSKAHRFRAVDEAGFYSLAKDLTRLIADSIDIQLLGKYIPPPKGEQWRSLKHLEKLLATFVVPEIAHGVMSPLFAVYELRLADAHPAGSRVLEALKLLRIDANLPPVLKGLLMLDSVVTTLCEVSEIVEAAPKK